MAKSTLKPTDYAETDEELADQLQLIANDVSGQSDWDDIEVTFCRAELRRAIEALRAKIGASA